MIMIVNYGLGNLQSVYNALDIVGADVKISHHPKDLREAEKIVLPGVGAFGPAMANLSVGGWDEALHREVVENKKPLLGICLGLQVLAEVGTERGINKGLAFVPGSVLSLKAKGLRLPHVGWNDVSIVKDHPILRNLSSKPIFYFVHTFKFVPKSDDVVAAKCKYGEEFAAAITSENIFATQFHPEKSQGAGLRLLENFVHWDGAEA
jgi:imidazole glycerol-phosphate synthase subunit HisH